MNTYLGGVVLVLEEVPEVSRELVWDRFRVGTGGGLAIECGTCGEAGALFVLL